MVVFLKGFGKATEWEIITAQFENLGELVKNLILFLPAGLLDYFDLVNHVSQETCFILFLEEKPSILQEYSHLHLHSKGFFPEVEDFPIRGKAVYLRVRRRRWEDPETGQTYSRDWDLVTSGTRITAEFVSFLKVLHPQT